MKKRSIQPRQIQQSILILRGQKVMLDRDLAELYGVETKRLNEQVKRNKGRFPKDFMFRLTKKEKDEVVANCDHLRALKYSRTNPYAFTEHGAVMLASVLNTELAVKTSILVVRAFIQLRKMLAYNKELIKRINELEAKYDSKFTNVFKVLKQIIEKPDPPRRPIGFRNKPD